jgi:coenzyme F420-reducing hydrogenase beta subunit
MTKGGVTMLAHIDSCCGCGVCAAKCNHSAINMTADAAGFLYPVVNASLCQGCGLCETACPVLHSAKTDTHNLQAYGGYLDNTDELLNSSSGGAFSALARAILRSGGYVCGAVYADDFRRVFHICSNNPESIDRMRGSKYVQSDKGKELYKTVSSLLATDVPVLFTGTPCEVASLKRYLNCDPQNLITCDLICHGPTTPLAQEQYVEYLEKKYSSTIKDFSMKYKKGKWMPQYLRAVFENGRIFCEPFYSTPLGFSFQSLGLRPSCYVCKYKDENRASDITLGDFWGIDRKNECYNALGTSAIIANTEKGIQLIGKIEGFRLFNTEYSLVAGGNRRLTTSTPVQRNNKPFLHALAEKGLIRAVKQFNRPQSVRGYLNRYMPRFIKDWARKLMKTV